MLSFTYIGLLLSLIVIALILRSRGFDNTDFGNDKASGLPFVTPNSKVITTLHEFEVNVDDVQLLRNVCPDNYCDGTTPNKSMNDSIEHDTVTECCIICECGDDCFELGNCCDDKKQLPGHTREDKTEVCTQASIISSNLKTMPPPVSYMLHQRCSDTDNASLVSKCNVADPGNMDEFIPVHSATTGRNYRNKYCAECNKDVEELVAWDTDVYCENYVQLIALFKLQTAQNISLITWLKSEYVKCALYLNAPWNFNPTQCLHPWDMIDRCDTISPLGEKCMTYYSPIYTMHHIFKNVFCQMCNEILQPLEEINCGAGRVIGVLATGVPILRLMTDRSNSASVSLYNTTNGSDDCLPSQVFDEYINSCIYIRCPMISLPEGDKCYPAFKMMKNVKLDFRAIVKIPGSIGYDPGAVLDEVWSLFKHQYIEEDVCKSQIMQMTVVESQMQVVVQTVITISVLKDIEEAFDIFVNNIDLYGKDVNSLFKIEVAKTAVLPITDMSVTLLFDDYYDEPCFAIAMTDLMFCRTIEISTFELLGNNTLLTNGLIFYPGEYAEVDFVKVRVCLDKYLLKHRINRRQTNQSNGFGSRLVNLYCVLILSILAYATSKLHALRPFLNAVVTGPTR